MNLSICIITKNEKKNLEKCLKHLSGYGFELVVVDTGSTDGTIDMVRRYTEAVYEFAWCDDFAKAKNYAVSKAQNDMVLVLDSDEYLERIDLEQLEEKIRKNPKQVGRILRKNYIYHNQEIRENFEYINRIFDRRYYQYEGKIHEQLVKIDGGKIETYIASIQVDHSGYLLTKEEKQKKADRNIALLKRALEEDGEDPYTLYQLGKSYYMAEEYLTASEYFSKALWFDLDPQLEYVIDLVETYGYSLINSNQAEQALGFAGLEEAFGGSSDFQFLLGLICMNNEHFSEAIKSFLKAVELHNARAVGVDSYLAYYNAGVICECLGNMEQATEYYWKCGAYLPAIKRLGEYYERKNPSQAYIYYRQQAYQSHGKEQEELQGLSKKIKDNSHCKVNKTAIVILSYNTLEETRNCIESIRKNCDKDTYELVVVDNASTDGSVEWLKAQSDIKLRCNEENAGFPKGCNQGIALAEPESDIWLLNSDTLVPPNALFWLQMGLYESAKVGAAGSVSNYAPNYQNIQDVTVTDKTYLDYAQNHVVSVVNPYEKKTWLVGFSLLLKREVLNEIGLLDEIFSPGNFEDTDIGFRLAKAGWQQLLCKNSFVFHHGSSSFGKKKNAFINLLETNRNKFIEKWKIHPSRYSYIKTWEADQITEPTEEKFLVLDAGCGTGATMARIQSRYPNAAVYGIEKKQEVAELAAEIGAVVAGDICEWKDNTYGQRFDYILTGGIWEHIEPEKLEIAFKQLKALAAVGCMLTGSIYNRNHPWQNCMPDELKNRDIGIGDAEHVVSYTAEEWLDILSRNGVKVEDFSFSREKLANSVKEPYQYFWKGYFV